MANTKDTGNHLSRNLVLLVIFWLGVLTGAIAVLLFMQAVNTADIKSSLFYTTPIKYSFDAYKPGPDPWSPTSTSTSTYVSP
jgi:hypothetical protein